MLSQTRFRFIKVSPHRSSGLRLTMSAITSKTGFSSGPEFLVVCSLFVATKANNFFHPLLFIIVIGCI